LTQKGRRNVVATPRLPASLVFSPPPVQQKVGTDFAMRIGAGNFLYAFSAANRLRSSVEDASGPLNFD